MTFIKPHCRVLSANISELVVQAEQLLDAWRDKDSIMVESHFWAIEGNYRALPEEIRGKMAHPLSSLGAQFGAEVGRPEYERTPLKVKRLKDSIERALPTAGLYVERYTRELQKTALSEGLVQIAACQLGNPDHSLETANL